MCRFIDAEKATEDNPDGCGVALLCRTLGVNRSTCYAWLASRPAVAERQCDDDELADRIREIHAGSRGVYGVPRVHAALRRGAVRSTGKGSSGSCGNATSEASPAASAGT